MREKEFKKSKIIFKTTGIMATRTYYISNKTEVMLHNMKTEAVKKYASIYKVPAALVLAVIAKESTNSCWPPRVEHHLKRAKWYNGALTGITWIRDYHYCSFGLMQIMYGTARHNGYIFQPFGLCNPDRGIKYGTKFLAKCIKRYKGNMWDGVAAYNQGNNRYYDVNKNGIKDEGEQYRNQAYVDRVFELYKQYGGTA